MPQATGATPIETRLSGIALSPGVALGRPCFLAWRHNGPDSDTRGDTGEQLRKLQQSLDRLAGQRSALAGETAGLLGPEHAEIFETHRLMLSDDTLRSQLANAIESGGCSAREAVAQVLDGYREQLLETDSVYLQQRAADIEEIRTALLADLNHLTACRSCRGAANCGIERCLLGNDHILIGREITASLPVETDSHTIGFIVENAGPNSHAMILARALHRPVVGRIRGLPDCIPAEAQLLVDGDNGEVILNPTAETLARFPDIHNRAGAGPRGSAPVTGLKVMANISLSTDVGDALAAGAEGVGLYRTEMELLVSGRLLSEDEQTLRYSRVVRAMGGKPVCIRLLDLHNDKTAGWLGQAHENPTDAHAHGGHLLLTRPELLRTQARALARASVHGPIHVLYPMIVGVDQFLALRRLFEEAVTGLDTRGLQHGVLFEVPAACLAASQLMRVADFGCIGTNDLIQYLFGIDRSDADSGSQYRVEHSGILWELIGNLSLAASGVGKPMAICGELAGDPELTGKIMQCGIATISTSPVHIADVRLAACRR